MSNLLTDGSPQEFRIKRGDTLPPFIASLSERDPNGALSSSRRPLDLSLVNTVRLLAKTRDGKRTINGTCSIVSPDLDDPIWDDYPGVTPYSYKIQYAWQTANTLVTALYNAEIELTFVGGAIQTIPARGYFTIVVEGDKS